MDKKSMNVTVIFDTDILIDVSRNIETAISFLENIEKNKVVGISKITEMELIIGCQNKSELKKLETFLNRFEIVDLSASIAKQSITLLKTYNLSHNLLIADSFIAATALNYSIPLASKNQRDFRFIKGLNLMQYPPAQFIQASNK